MFWGFVVSSVLLIISLILSLSRKAFKFVIPLTIFGIIILIYSIAKNYSYRFIPEKTYSSSQIVKVNKITYNEYIVKTNDNKSFNVVIGTQVGNSINGNFKNIYNDENNLPAGEYKLTVGKIITTSPFYDYGKVLKRYKQKSGRWYISDKKGYILYNGNNGE